MLRELLALDHHGIGHLESQQAEETLGAIEIAHRDRDVIEKQDHRLLLLVGPPLRGHGSYLNWDAGIEAVPLTFQSLGPGQYLGPGAHERHVVDPRIGACCQAVRRGPNSSRTAW